MPKFSVFLLAVGAVLFATLLAACSDSQQPSDAPRATDVPLTLAPANTLAPAPIVTPTAEPTNMPTLVPTNTLANTPTPMPSATPATRTTPTMAGATAYVQECEVASASLEAVFGRNEVDDSNASSDLMWGEFAQTFDAFASAYRRIDPPPELESYHGANLSAAEALRDLALTRPSGESFTQEFLTLAAQPIVMALVEIGNDLTKTDEEKERLAEETVREKYAEFLRARVCRRISNPGGSPGVAF